MIPVEPHFLYSIRDQASFTWKSMLCELIDNAFDAAATDVRVAWPGGEVFEISEDADRFDPVAYVLSTNLHRRHLSQSQRRQMKRSVSSIAGSAHTTSDRSLSNSELFGMQRTTWVARRYEFSCSKTRTHNDD